MSNVNFNNQQNAGRNLGIRTKDEMYNNHQPEVKKKKKKNVTFKSKK